MHAVVARSTFRSQNVQNTSVSDDFWKLRRRKSARRCGAKHISKSKCTKHLSVGRLLEVEMSKKCTPLWREALFELKMYKTPQVLGPLLEVEMLSTLKNEEVSQNILVFKLADRQVDRQTDRQTER